MNVDPGKRTFGGVTSATSTDTSTSATVKTEKLEFAAEEMFVALRLAAATCDDFNARAVARHVLVRARDFIALVYDLLGVLRRSGLDVEAERKRVGDFAAPFEEYFATTRTKLAAHVQNLEFAERLELWTDIDLSKLTYFAEGAYEILNGIRTLRGQTPLAQPAVPSGRRTSPLDPTVQMGADVLASTRPNTVALLNFTPVHQRAGELATISRWLRAEWNVLLAHPPLVEARVLKARIITDAVSFADCLSTRTDGDPAHRIAGLDDLVRGCDGGDASAIDEFRAAYRFERDVSELRTVRNHIGAHLERDDALDLIALLTELDAVSLDRLASLMTRMAAIFRMTCRRTLFLGSYLADGEPFVGASAARAPLKTFDGNIIVPEFAPQAAPASVREALEFWISSNGTNDRIRHWFGDAFQPRRFETVDGVPVPQLTEAHEVVLDGLLHASSGAEADCIMRLIEGCARSFPNELAEVLRRVYEATDGCRKRNIALRALVRALGMLPLNNGEWARKPIRDAVLHADPLIAAQGCISLVQHVAVDVVTVRRGTLFHEHIEPALAERVPLTQLLILLALASTFTSTPVASRLQPDELSAEYEAVKVAISAVIPNVLHDNAAAKPWSMFLNSGDFIGFAALAAERLAASDAEGARLLRRACCEGLIKPSAHPDVVMVSLANLAVVQLHADQQVASRIARHVIVTYPLAVDLQVAMLGVLLSAGVPAKHVRAELEAFVAACNLPCELEPRVLALRNECEAKLNAEQPRRLEKTNGID